MIETHFWIVKCKKIFILNYLSKIKFQQFGGTVLQVASKPQSPKLLDRGNLRPHGGPPSSRSLSSPTFAQMRNRFRLNPRQMKRNVPSLKKLARAKRLIISLLRNFLIHPPRLFSLQFSSIPFRNRPSSENNLTVQKSPPCCQLPSIN